VAVKRLQLARATIIGALMTKFDMRQAGYGYAYGYGGYDYQGRGESDAPRLAARHIAE
jgi:hypothetical protein